jgi:tRNA/tmRNA/rRNA uracil-C5-methylase (TrmA/RlmC/RlmD family)
VIAATRPGPGERALDLYSGVGLFATALGVAVGSRGGVVAVESDEGACADARRNLYDLPQVEIVRDRVEVALARLADREPTDGLDLVVLDPPRSGAGRSVMALLARLRPRRIAYVACDPATLARDVALAAADGYRLTALRAFDLFPMTHHVECLATLEPAR